MASFKQGALILEEKATWVDPGVDHASLRVDVNGVVWKYHNGYDIQLVESGQVDQIIYGEKTFIEEGGLIAVNPVIKSATYDVKFMRFQDDLLSAPISGSLNQSVALGGKTIGYMIEDSSLSGGFRLYGMTNGSSDNAGLSLYGEGVSSIENGNNKAPIVLESICISGASDSSWLDSDTIVQVRNNQSSKVKIKGNGIIEAPTNTASYQTAAGQSISGSQVLNTVIFGTSVQNGQNCVTTSASDWYYTCPNAGIYYVKAHICYTSSNWQNSGVGELRNVSLSLRNEADGEIRRLAFEYFTTTASSFYKTLQGSCLVVAAKGTIFRIKAFHDKTAAVALYADGNLNYVAISYLGT